MRVGLTLDFRNAANCRRPWREFWEDGLWLLAESEAMGFDAVWIQEHFFTDDGYAPSVPVFLTLLAERTQRIRIGSYLYVLLLHHPAQLAQETAVLDQICGGRLDVAVGLGHRRAEFLAFGVDPKSRAARMEEALEVLTRAWTERPFSYEGEFYSLTDLEVQPEPAQRPHPPLWVGATSVPAAERAGRHGAYLAAGSTDLEVFDAYRRAWKSAGHDPAAARVAIGPTITTTYESPDAVWARNRDLYFERWDFYRRIRTELGHDDLRIATRPQEATGPDDRPSPESYRQNELIGDPETVLEVLEPLVRSTGATDLVLNGPASGIDWRTEGYESVKLFAERVLPTLRAW